MPGGLTNTGYVASTVDEEVLDLNQQFLANVNGALDLAPDQPFGQVIAIFAEKYVEAMELGATVYNALNPEAAEGQLLTNVCAISGTYPQVATFSKVVCNMTLQGFATVPAGATVQVNGQPTNVWVLQQTVTNTLGTTQVLPGNFDSQVAGPQVGNAGTLTVIGTPTTGWTAVTNPLDAVQGLAADTDTTLRQKRAVELLGEGSGDTDAIRAAVLKVGGVIQCFVYENTTLTVDANGLPGKAFRVVIWDGLGMAASNANIAQAIWNSKPSGIQSYGASSGNAIDSLGNTQVMNFDRAVQIPIYISVNTNDTLTTAQIAGVKSALALFASTNYNLGVSVVWNTLFQPVQSVIGLQEHPSVSTLFVGIQSSPTQTADILLSGLQIATVSTLNILVNGL
jgi:uncharacterized phage protein gp47/JayE